MVMLVIGMAIAMFTVTKIAMMIVMVVMMMIMMMMMVIR